MATLVESIFRFEYLPGCLTTHLFRNASGQVWQYCRDSIWHQGSFLWDNPAGYMIPCLYLYVVDSPWLLFSMTCFLFTSSRPVLSLWCITVCSNMYFARLRCWVYGACAFNVTARCIVLSNIQCHYPNAVCGGCVIFIWNKRILILSGLDCIRGLVSSGGLLNVILKGVCTTKFPG